MLEHRQELISGPNIPIMELVHNDPRRTIREAAITVPGSPLRRITEIVVKRPEAGQTMDLGNHYHEKPEDFVIVEGTPKVSTAHIDNPSQVVVKVMSAGDTITMQPGVAHKFSFDGPGQLRSTMEGTFEESGTQTYKL